VLLIVEVVRASRELINALFANRVSTLAYVKLPNFAATVSAVMAFAIKVRISASLALRCWTKKFLNSPESPTMCDTFISEASI